MRKALIVSVVTFGLGALTFGSFAQDDTPFARQIKARQAFMQVYAFNLGQLGAMARGDMEYNADLAKNSAANLLAAASMSNGAMWPEGSDSSAAGLADVTRAKVEMWQTYPEVADKQKALVAALTELSAVAGDGLGAVRSNMGAVGDGCKGCHEPFRGIDRLHWRGPR